MKIQCIRCGRIGLEEIMIIKTYYGYGGIISWKPLCPDCFKKEHEENLKPKKWWENFK